MSRLVTVLDRDRLLAAALFAVFEIPVLSQGLAAGHDPQGASWKWTAVGAVTGAVMTLAVAGRRQRPRRTWLIACACALFLLATPTQLGLPFTAGPAQTALLVLPAPGGRPVYGGAHRPGARRLLARWLRTRADTAAADSAERAVAARRPVLGRPAGQWQTICSHRSRSPRRDLGAG